MRNKFLKVHIPNSGRLEEVLVEGREVFYYPRSASLTQGVIQLAKGEKGLVSVDSRVPNYLIKNYLERKALKFNLILKKEARIGKRRVDFLLKNSEKIWVETKSITLVKNGIALFPDSPTLRGREQIKELIKIKEEGESAVVIFIVQREDADGFSPNRDVDPDFSEIIWEAKLKGVEIMAFNCSVSLKSIHLNKNLEVIL